MTVWKSRLWGGYGREMSVVITTHLTAQAGASERHVSSVENVTSTYE